MGQFSNTDIKVDDVKIAIVVSRFNEQITTSLLDGALNEFDRRGVSRDNIDVYYVPGSLELAVVAKECAGSVDAVVCLGAVIRGDTPHFEYVCDASVNSIAQVGLETSTPCIFGVLTVDNTEQAKERIGGSKGHKGEEAAASALEVIATLKSVRMNTKSTRITATGFRA